MMPKAASAVLLATTVVPTVLALNLRTGGPEELQQAVRRVEQRHTDRQLWGRESGSGTSTRATGNDDRTDGGRGDGARNSTRTADDDDDIVADEAYTHIGCFQIDEEIVAGYGASNFSYSSEMSTSQCYKKCSRRGATFMALANGFICWCGCGEEDEYSQGGVGMCDTPCWGDEDMMCGGEEAFDLYHIEEGEMAHSSMASTSSPMPPPMENKTNEMGTSTFSHMSTGDEFEPLPTRGPVSMMSSQEIPTPPSIETQTVTTSTTSTSTTPTPMVTPRTRAPATSVTSTSSKSSTSGSAPADMEMLLEMHNLARCEHNADPLTWSDTVAASAAEYAQVLADACGSLVHSDSIYGENLYMCYGSTSCYSPERAMEGLYEEEINSSSIDGYGGHATQILWKSTTELGCALAYCGDRTYLVCQYNPPGNYIGMYDENVEVAAGNGCYS